MVKFRALLSFLFACVAFVLVGCGGPAAVSVPPTYTDAQLQQIQQYLPEIQSAYERLDALGAAIQAGNWQEVRSTIRGPFGSMIQDLKYVNSHLLPADQKVAQELSRNIFQDFVDIDQAAASTNVNVALQSFNTAVQDIEKFLGQLPELPAQAADAASEAAAASSAE
ncbi:MAG TPA: photosystem II protein PsbQ [Stenomitos sp.]